MGNVVNILRTSLDSLTQENGSVRVLDHKNIIDLDINSKLETLRSIDRKTYKLLIMGTNQSGYLNLFKTILLLEDEWEKILKDKDALHASIMWIRDSIIQTIKKILKRTDLKIQEMSFNFVKIQKISH